MIHIHKKHFPHIAGVSLLLISLCVSIILFFQSNSTPTFAGATLTTIDSTGDVGSRASIALGSDGFARISYFDNTNLDLKFVQCTNATCSTNNITTVASTGTVGTYNSVTMAADGYARISYYDQDNHVLKFVQCTNDACSTNNISTADSGSGSWVGGNNFVTMAADGYARISYKNENTGELKFLQCTNAACSSSVITALGVTSGAYNIPITMAADGYARMAYVDVSVGGTMKFVQCTNDACSTNNISTLETGVFPVMAPKSISMGTDTFARMAYYISGTTLKFVQCTNAACSTKNTTTIDSVSFDGTQGAMDAATVIASDGYARISYSENTNHDLKYVQCTNDACSTNIITSIDTSGFVGSSNSIALASDGYARIAYYYSTGGDLKFAQCTSASCGNDAPTAPTTLYSNTYASGAQSGSANPTTLASKDIVVSAIHNDSDGDAANKYQLQVATDNAFSTVIYDSGGSGTTMTSTANGVRSPNIEAPAPISENTTYYWRIRFWDTVGNIGAYSASGGSAATFKTSAGLAPDINILDSTGDVGTNTSTTFGADGYARISYYDTTNGDLKFIQCTNANCTTNVTTVVDSAVSVGSYGDSTYIQIAADGFARIAYSESSNFDLSFVQCTNAACSTNVITTVDSTGFVGRFASFAMASDGFARIGYYDSTNGDLKFAQCTNASCSTSTITTVDSTGTVGTDSSVTLGTDGFARISYIDSTNSDLKFAQCTNASCSSKNLTSVETAGFIFSDSTAIAMASDGYARITFANLNDFRFVQCTNDACSTNVRTSVGTLASSSSATSSFVMASDGYARITFAGGTTSNHNLEYIKCTNAACSTKASATVSGSGNMGQYSSIALGSDGYPRISYYDATNQDLKFAQCTNNFCLAVDNTAPTTPTILYANIASATAQTGSANPTTINSNEVVVSAIHNDAESDVSTLYQVQVATDNAFSSITYDSGSSGTSMTSTASGARSPDILISATLTTGTTYYWRIRFWDTYGNIGAYSASGGSAATFTTMGTFSPALTTLDSTGTVGQYTSTTIGSDGFARISYYDTTNGDLKFVQCTNTTCSTSVITTVDSSATIAGQYTSIAMGSDGFARISYGVGSFSVDDLRFVQCTNASCSTNVVTTLDTAGTVGQYTSIAMGSDGFARISYYDATNGDLKFVQCTNAACSTNVITTVDSTGQVGQYTSIAMASDGFARIGYYDVTNRDLKFVQCSNDACSSNVITTVDSSTASAGQYTSIAMASDGFARISYGVGSSGVQVDDLKFAQCTNAACSTNVQTSVDTTGTVGLYTSLKVASDGFGRISYYDSTNGNLKYAQCTNAACSTSVLTVLNVTGSVGLYTSLALSTSGYPRIAYYDNTNADLKFVSCSTNDCTGVTNTAPSAPTTLYSNNQTDTAQAGSTNPTNLTGDTIVFSAVYNDSDVGDIANKYRLQIATDTGFSSVIYDSGSLGTSITNITAGNRSSDITATGFTPVDNTTYYWRIKFWDDDNTEGTYSPSGGSAASFGYALPTISFDIDTALTDSESAAPYSISLGTLSPQTLTTSDGTTISSIFLDLTSNASNGATITVLGSHGGLYSASKAHTITLDTNEETIEAGQEKFGMCVASITKAGGTGLFTAGSTYDADGASNCTIANAGTPKIGKINTTETTIAQTNGTITGGRVQILTKASITTTTPAASDYEEVMTFIATGSY